MPIAKFKMPDGRIGKFRVPEGTTPEQAMAFINENFKSTSEKPKGTFEKGGFVDKSVLSGQLPFAGTLFGGGTGVATANPLIGVAGAGFGNAAGGVLERIARQRLGFDKPQNFPQAFVSTGKDILTGAASQAAGESIVPAAKLIGGPVVKGVQKITNPVVTPVIKAVQKTSNTIAKKLATSSFPQSGKEVAEAVIKEKPTIGESAIARGLYGFKSKVLELARQGKEASGQQIDDLLNSVDDKLIDPSKIVQSLDEVTARLKATGNEAAVKQVEKRGAYWLDNILNKKSEIFIPVEGSTRAIQNGWLNPTEANLLKRYFGQEADTFFKKESADAVSSINAEFANAMRSGLKKEIESIVPGIKMANKEYRIYDDVIDAVAQGISKDLRSNGLTIKLPSGAAAGIGLAAGGGTGAVAGFGAAQISRSFPVQTFLASQLQKLAGKELTPGLATEVSSTMLSHPIFRQAIFKSIGTAMTKSSLEKKGKE